MPDAETSGPPSTVDLAYARAQAGDPRGFEAWVRLVEPPLRASLSGFARSVDVEAVVQEGLLRMWVLAPRLTLVGRDAPLRYALTLVRNLVRREAQRLSRFDHPEASPEPVTPDPHPPDPALRRAILACLQELPRRPQQALAARIEGDRAEADRDLAACLGMRLNTFLQNVVRARRLLAQCLESRGISLLEVWR